jgi:hypothetical protein
MYHAYVMGLDHADLSEETSMRRHHELRYWVLDG